MVCPWLSMHGSSMVGVGFLKLSIDGKLPWLDHGYGTDQWFILVKAVVGMFVLTVN